MKKKNLIILLIFPFLISVFCIVTVNTTYNKIDVDISYIEWSYNDMEAFQISDATYQLEAVGVNQRYYKVSGDGALVWSVENKNSDDPDPCAEIVQKNGKYFLKAIREGEVIITCSNKKGNVYRQMTGVIYKDAAILLYPKIGSSQTNIDSTIYYGEYDHKIGQAASIEMTMFVVPTSAAQEMNISHSNNISFNRGTGVIDIRGTGKANLTITLPSGLAAPRSFEFEIVDEGVNVYNYEDLLYCTNTSENGEIAVLRKSFESLYNAYVLNDADKPLKDGDGYQKKNANVECFGNYNSKTGKFSFDQEVYRFTTTYNKNFIEQWNEFVKTNTQYSPITDKVVVGLRVQKDFYGNGYTINLHNLTYPYSYLPMNDETGQVVRIPQLTADNLFRGPLKLYSLGDPNNVPLVSLYGQDNIGMYIDGDNITVNDVNIKNCEFGDRLANLSTVGTVMEVAGRNVTVKNCQISNGKNVLRSFSSMDLTVSNCILSNSQNFLFVTGANEFVSVDSDAVAVFSQLDGSTKTEVIGKFLEPKADGDAIINKFLVDFCGTSSEKAAMRRALESIQSALNAQSNLKGNFKGSTKIDNCYFYRSGISSICLESMFNSPFLETNSPSMITQLFSMMSEGGKTLVPYTAKQVTGTSYPVKLEILGDTRFYDYKTADAIELEGLIEENITDVANSLGLYDAQIDLDTVFPLKSMAMQKANNQGSAYRDPESGKQYVNIPIAYYGGGLNLSEVNVSGAENSSSYSGELEIDLMESYLNLSGSSDSSNLSKMKGLVLKTVITVTGFEPFQFRFIRGGYLYGETPKVTELVANAKGE
ncbi:MAG: hypothetical protein E7641_05955 [Ruminococcaceae bacterium]|nr:hypothetical protein [Oscillospiraceae bacterium]